MTNMVTADEATLIRACAAEGLHGEAIYATRIWAPIEYTEGTGKAKCRECGGQIAKAERCIVFAFDVYGGKDKWGRLNRAYLHIECKEDS